VISEPDSGLYDPMNKWLKMFESFGDVISKLSVNTRMTQRMSINLTCDVSKAHEKLV
jgi:hypothetical protein